MVYRWGQRSYGVSADVAGKVMEKLEARGELTPPKLVEVSRPEDAPLHKCFEWDDAKAAEGYRVIQARKIIQAIEIVREDVETEDAKPVQIRAFHALQDEETNSYESLEHILSDEEKTERLMELAVRDMQIFRDKYQTIERLSKVFDAMEEVMEENA